MRTPAYLWMGLRQAADQIEIEAFGEYVIA
jgi:hypothetical protein